MPSYCVYLYVGYLPHIRDPEGETIKRELFDKAGIQAEVRAGKCIVLRLEAASEQEAKSRALEYANALRLGNPHVHVVDAIRVEPCR